MSSFSFPPDLFYMGKEEEIPIWGHKLLQEKKAIPLILLMSTVRGAMVDKDPGLYCSQAQCSGWRGELLFGEMQHRVASCIPRDSIVTIKHDLILP